MSNADPLALVIDSIFIDADIAHNAHLLTQSYPEHVALGEFYSGAREKVDTLIETMIALDLPTGKPEEGDVLGYLEGRYTELVSNREVICQGAAVVENLFDDLLSTYTSAIYKLKRFKSK